MKIINKQGREITIKDNGNLKGEKRYGLGRKKRKLTNKKYMDEISEAVRIPKKGKGQKNPIINEKGSKYWVKNNGDLMSRILPSVILSAGRKSGTLTIPFIHSKL